MSLLAKCDARWKADRIRKQLEGMVVHELADYEGQLVEIPFEPKVEFWEELEPHPWVVV